MAAILAGCAGASAPLTTPSGSTLSSPDPTATLVEPTETPSVVMRTPTPTPTATPPADLPLRVELVRDGIRVLVHLDQNPLEAGTPTWASIEVSNVSHEDVIWSHDGCAIPAGISGEMASSWRSGIEQSGNAAKFKAQAIDDRLGNGQILIYFTPEPFVGKGEFGCADIGIAETLRPGDARHMRLRWSGMVARDKGLPPAGPVTLQIQAIYFRPKSHTFDTQLKAEVPSWMTSSRGAIALDPPEVVDAALADDALRTLVGGLDFLHGGFSSYLWYEPAIERWHVGVVVFCEDCPGHGTVHGVDVNPHTGGVLERVEQPWDGIPR
jgi:hypothetical protein